MSEKNIRNIHEQVSFILSERKKVASKLKEERIKYAEDNIPGYTDINEKIRQKGLSLGRVAFKGKNSDEYKNIQYELEKLIAEKELLIKKLGENFFEDVYFCKKCSDDGYYVESGKNVRCQCYKQLLADMLAKNFAITPDMGTFDTFRTDVYTFDPNDEEDMKDQSAIAPLSASEYMAAVLKKCRAFAEDYDTKKHTKNLLLWGKSGVGKSFMCNAIAYDLITKGVPVLYVSAPSMLAKATAVTVNEEQRLEKQEFCDLIRNIDVLIIDDLGTEKQSDAKYQELLEVINERSRKFGKGLRTVISTNLSQKNMFRYYDERIASRLYAEFISLKFIGENIRFKKK